MNENNTMQYTCPMHPEIQQDTPGMCPECGMNLVKGKSEARNSKSETNLKHGDHDKHSFAKATDGKHAGHKPASFLTKFWIALSLSVPIFFYSEMAMELFDVRGPEFANWPYAMLVLGSIVFFYCGWIFLASAYREIRARLPGMMTLIAIAITAAYLYSFISVLYGTGHDLWFELSSLIAIMLIGHFIEMRAVQGAQGALKELSKLLPDKAELADGRIISLSELKTSDIVVVRPGGNIPADGVVVDGLSDVNESMVTGESAPVSKKIDDKVIAGTINGDGNLKIRVTDVGEKTFLSGVMRLVKEAQASKSRLQILSDRAALYLTFVALGAGGLTFVVWLGLGEMNMAFTRLVAVLVIACPHALGLAVPLVASISTTMAARNGFLIRQRLALEAARTITTVFFDKTGTLTEGAFKVTSSSSDETLILAASVDANSEHPIAKAIVNEARIRKLIVPTSTQFQRIAGVGGEGIVDGKKVFVGHRGGPDIVVEIDGSSNGGPGKEIGRISVADALRPESKEAVAALISMGVKPVMITGDSEEVAAVVAKELGITEYFARVLPGQKSEKVKLLQSRGERVAMVGDGINDAPALTQADVGIAIGAGTNVAIESAGIILVKNDPRDIAKVIHLSRLTYSKMIQNLWWAAGYNIVAIPLAAGVLASKGILLQPAVAAIFMSVSTVIVAGNALLLRKQVL